jgi:GTP-binding protein
MPGGEARFVAGAATPARIPRASVAEIALAGRSNVGKSSLLYRLVGRHSLARVSRTPGRTQQINFFAIGDDLMLVDLPGYGFAKASKVDRAAYRRLVEGYVSRRPTLAGVVWLLDARHEPSKDDLVFQQVLIEAGRPTLAVLTKADKLGRGQQREQVAAIARALGLPQDQVQLVSSAEGLGIAELGASILSAVGGVAA